MLTSTGGSVRCRRLWVIGDDTGRYYVLTNVRHRSHTYGYRDGNTFGSHVVKCVECLRLGRYDPERDILVVDDPSCLPGPLVLQAHNIPRILSVTGGWQVLRRWLKREWFADKL